jgi:predicted phage-related endonuclease
MKVLNLKQGTPEWHAHRRTARNASEAAAMLGVSPYMTRTELLTILKTGIRPEPTPQEQQRFDKGHAIEAALRPIAEKIIGEALYPLVATDDEGYLSGSYDGLTMAEDIGWECKSLNDELRAVFAQFDLAQDDGSCGRALPIYHQIQMEQDLAISGAEKFLFSAGDIDDDGNVTDARHCWYFPNLELRDRIVKAWKQGDKELPTFEPPPADAPRVVAQPMESLPAVLVNVTGTLAVKSNLDVFGQTLRSFIDKIPTRPSTDQEFADTEAACKALKKAEEALESEESRALASIADVQTMRNLVSELRELAKSTRLAREKMVDARKREIRLEIHQEFTKALADHVAQLNVALGQPYMPRTEGNWAEVMKNKRTVASLREACSNELAECKIGADEVFRRIQTNLNALRDKASDHKFLFADTRELVLKPCDDVATVIDARIANHRAEQERKERETRERLERETREKVEREQREAAEAKRRQEENDAASKASAALAESRKSESLPPELQTALEGVTADLTADLTIARAANTSKVTPLRAGNPTLTMKEIHERISLPITAVFIENTLGIKPAKREKSAVFFLDTDWDRICTQLVVYVESARQQHRLAA